MALNRDNITSLCGFEHFSMLMNTYIINVKEPVMDFQVTGIIGNNVCSVTYCRLGCDLHTNAPSNAYELNKQAS